MDIELLKEYLTLAETLSFTKSASMLHLAQSTLSKHLAMLESDVGAKLFERTTNSARLTRAGRVFYEYALSMVEKHREMVDSVGGIAKDGITVLGVCGNTILAPTNRILAGMTVEAVRSGTPVRFEYAKPRSLAGGSRILRSADLLAGGESDLALALVEPGSATLEEFRALKVHEERCLIFAAADHPMVGRHGVTIGDIAGSSLAMFAAYPDCPAMMVAAFESAGFVASRKRIMPVEDMLEIPENLAMLQGNEITPLQESLCEFYGLGVAGGFSDLHVLDIAGEPIYVTTYLLARKDDDRPAVFQAFEIAARLVDRSQSEA